ncbi:FecR domain-containing protein [filamentous cyanobacterium LEGE 11480]|uniref:FecR domain-containing protein n=1 Tax=Romeriopsis navalis LEGE 11480 TaxID=2777977 RepID=A0A928VS24_9CYAN|nr:FecR domain-containing protein [Romeriopsis navalis]MBE9031931.1 FecR domain-containing protein [Romeriopsis navalis LEGE 11480]
MAQRPIRVRVKRELTLKNLSGNVNFKPRQQDWRRARPNEKITAVGEQVKTGKRSTVSLMMDVGIGSIQVAPTTLIQLRGISINPDQSRISLFYMPYGSARLKLRRFTNPNTRFELNTPAGVSGVRGTEFGIAVQPSGKTSVAVLDGRVNTSAQGEDVDVDAGFQNFTIPGEPPSPPVPLNNDTSLSYQLEKRIVRQVRRLTWVGQVDPVNIVSVNGEVVDTDREGKFRYPIQLRSFPKLSVLVQTPLGKEKNYDLRLMR